jgi:SNF2 family DNA or RNA helicase
VFLRLYQMAVLGLLLRNCHRKASRVIVFSHSLRLLDLTQTLMSSEGWAFRRLDGSMTLKARSKAVKEYQTHAAIFAILVSTKAGGVGLNLTAADTVIVFDPDWNPAQDLQAQVHYSRICCYTSAFDELFLMIFLIFCVALDRALT